MLRHPTDKKYPNSNLTVFAVGAREILQIVQYYLQRPKYTKLLNIRFQSSHDLQTTCVFNCILLRPVNVQNLLCSDRATSNDTTIIIIPTFAKKVHIIIKYTL